DALPISSEGQWDGGAATDPLRGAHPAPTGGDPDLLGRGARHHRRVQPGREQLRPQTSRLRGIHQGRATARLVLAADESSPAAPSRSLSAMPVPTPILLLEDDPQHAELE